MTPSESAVALLVLAVPETRRLLDEHIASYGEVLPTVFFGELADWVIQSPHDESDLVPADGVLNVMEHLLVAGGSDVKDLVATGFLETLPPDGLRED